MYASRKELYERLEELYSCKILSYITSDRPGFEAQIAHDAIDIFINQLDKIGVVDRIGLYLYTRGGDSGVSWNVVNLIRMYCDELFVIIPHKAHSGGTLISIGANKIIMTKQATLSPIDPSVNTPLNPSIPGMIQSIPPNNSPQTFPVSVEAVKGYLEFATKELAIKDDAALAEVMKVLAEKVHPLVLGQVYRSRAQIKMLAEKLLRNQSIDQVKSNKIIDFLCSDSGSHDYMINRREARELGLNVANPSDTEYEIVKTLFDDFSSEMLFDAPFSVSLNPMNPSHSFNAVKAAIESIPGGSDTFITEGSIDLVNNPTAQPSLSTNITFEGWKHE